MTTEQVKIQVTADGSKVAPEIAKVTKELGGLTTAAKGVESGLTKLGGVLAGAFSVGAITAFLVKVNSAADSLNDLAQRMGASASGLQAIQIAAAQAGGSIEAVEPAMAKMTQTIGEAMAGGEKAAAAFDHLGLSAKQLSGLKADEAFRLINQSLSEIPNTFERASAAQAIFGKGAKELAGLYGEGQKAIDDVNAALERQGAAISDLDVTKIGVMNDELQFQGVVVQNLGTKFLAGLSPAIGVATGALSEMLGNLGGASEAGNKFGVIMVAAIKSIESAAYGLASVFETVREIIAKVLSVITGSVSDILSAFGYLTDLVGLDSMAASLQRGADVMGGISESLDDISKRASANADAAGQAAIKAATEIVRAGELFAAAQAQYEQKAAEAAARNAANQGLGTGYQLPEGAGGTKKGPKTLEQMQQGALSDLNKTVTGQLFSPAGEFKFNPAGDLEAMTADARNKYLQEQYDAHSATMLGKLESFNQTWLGSMLVSNQSQIDAEAYKNMTIGDMMANFASMAMQHGGALGKVGKAIAIAQTVWATASAVVQSYQNAGGYPMGIPAAVAMAAAGVAQLANIKKTNIGSGGSIVSAKGGGGGAPNGSPFPSGLSNSTPAASTESQQKNAVQIIVNGSLFAAQETVDWLVEKIGDAVNNRDVVFINGSSRQAMELTA